MTLHSPPRHAVGWRALAVLLALGVAGGLTTPASADTGRAHSGRTGAHQLIDTDTSPGATCNYDAVSGSLGWIEARAPRVYAVDATAGTDVQQVGARGRLQRRATPADAWVTVASGPSEHATATDAASPFTLPVRFAPRRPGDYRVQWVLTWYGPKGNQTGSAIHEVDRYGLHLGAGLSLGVAKQFCAASRRGSPSVLVRHGPRHDPNVALTFDFGGRVGDAVSIMRWLTANDVPATLFPTGSSSSGTAGHRVLDIAAEHPELFVVGNHSWSHPDFRTLTAGQIAAELRDAEAAVAPLSGRTTKPWFRPPYGGYDEDVLAAVGSAGWSLTVVWDTVTDDYLAPADGGPTPAELVQEVLGHARNGSIVIMHLGGYATREALPEIVAGLRGRGFTLVTLETLLGM